MTNLLPFDDSDFDQFEYHPEFADDWFSEPIDD